MSNFTKSNKAIRPIKCAVVGLGRSGVDIHIELLQNNACFSIVAVSDNNKRKADNIGLELNCKSYINYSDVLSDKDVELVIIATPSNTHYKMAIMALNSKKHVVLEKPIADSIDRLNNLISVSKSTKFSLTPFFNFRFSDEFRIIKSILKKELIGDVFLIKKNIGYFNRRDDWQSISKNEGGILNAAAIHHLDQILQLTNEIPKSIWSDVKNIVSKGDAEDHCKILMKFPSKIVADLEVSWAEAVSSYPWAIYGSNGAIQQSGNKLKCKWFVDSEVEFKEPDEMSYLSNEKITWHEDIFELDEHYSLGLNMVFYDKLFDSIRKGIDYQPVTLQSVLKTMEIMEIIRA